MVSSLDAFFCLNAAADFYVDLRILTIEMSKDSSVRLERNEVARIAHALHQSGHLRRLRYHAEKQAYEEFVSSSPVEDVDWFEITQEGRTELDRLYLDDSPSP
ncbi:MAG TPA: hypothetical protein VK961_22145 [Chthoniobacter sp.]|nr:hypothetical protein [Chthoniobacter sp.]